MRTVGLVVRQPARGTISKHMSNVMYKRWVTEGVRVRRTVGYEEIINS